jgi:predicted peptidase
MLGGLLSAGLPTGGDGGRGRLESRSVEVEAAHYSYQLHVPAQAEGNAAPPLIIFLHGIGQRGSGGFLPTSGPGGALARHYLGQVPAVVLLPQCRAGSYWSDPLMDEMVSKATAQTLEETGADARRVYLTGVSMGGYGVWHMASQHPGKFAALVSVCGGSPLQGGERFAPIAERVGATPAWVFHGADDRVVPVSESRRMVEALKAAGAGDAVRYSEYEGVGHNVWMQVLGEKELLPWLLRQRLG